MSRKPAPFESRWILDQRTGCHVWQANRDKDGYGKITINRVSMRAHRVSFARVFGEIPPGAMVCHRCDNPPCVNPEHLFLGTAQENAADQIAKGRRQFYRGSAHGCAKLTDRDVLEIRAASGAQREIADRFGVSRGLVGRIQRGERWKHLP